MSVSPIMLTADGYTFGKERNVFYSQFEKVKIPFLRRQFSFIGSNYSDCVDEIREIEKSDDFGKYDLRDVKCMQFYCVSSQWSGKMKLTGDGTRQDPFADVNFALDVIYCILESYCFKIPAILHVSGVVDYPVFSFMDFQEMLVVDGDGMLFKSSGEIKYTEKERWYNYDIMLKGAFLSNVKYSSPFVNNIGVRFPHIYNCEIELQEMTYSRIEFHDVIKSVILSHTKNSINAYNCSESDITSAGGIYFQNRGDIPGGKKTVSSIFGTKIKARFVNDFTNAGFPEQDFMNVPVIKNCDLDISGGGEESRTCPYAVIGSDVVCGDVGIYAMCIYGSSVKTRKENSTVSICSFDMKRTNITASGNRSLAVSSAMNDVTISGEADYFNCGFGPYAPTEDIFPSRNVSVNFTAKTGDIGGEYIFDSAVNVEWTESKSASFDVRPASGGGKRSDIIDNLTVNIILSSPNLTGAECHFGTGLFDKDGYTGTMNFSTSMTVTQKIKFDSSNYASVAFRGVEPFCQRSTQFSYAIEDIPVVEKGSYHTREIVLPYCNGERASGPLIPYGKGTVGSDLDKTKIFESGPACPDCSTNITVEYEVFNLHEYNVDIVNITDYQELPDIGMDPAENECQTTCLTGGVSIAKNDKYFEYLI